MEFPRYVYVYYSHTHTQCIGPHHTSSSISLSGGSMANLKLYVYSSIQFQCMWIVCPHKSLQWNSLIWTETNVCTWNSSTYFSAQMAQISRSSDHHLPRSVLHDVYILSVLLSHFYEICSAISSINYLMNTLTYMATLGYTLSPITRKGWISVLPFNWYLIYCWYTSLIRTPH